MANNYDRIFKENIESMLLPLLEKVLGLIPPKLVPIDAKMQMTHESEMDNIRRVVHEEDAALDYGLQIEFHISSGAKISVHFYFATGLDKALEMNCLLI